MATVLVVDDDLDTCDLLSLYLGHAGHDVVCAANGWEGLLELDRQRVDLILLDVMMPGMDGATFLNVLRNTKEGATTPVVVISALDPDRARAGLGRFEVADVLTKTPGFYDAVVDAVRRHARTPAAWPVFGLDMSQHRWQD